MFAQLEAPKTVITVKVNHSAKRQFVWQADFGSKVIYFCDDRQQFRTGIYFGTWAERSGNNEASPFLHECMPYCKTPDKEVTRAFILDLEGFSDYADVELVGEWTMANFEWAHSQNQDLQQQAAIERLEAFGEVEAA